MPFRITQLPSEGKLCRTLSWPILEQFYPRQRIEQLTESICGQTTRVRKLTLVLVVWVLICWHLYLGHSLGAVFLKLSSAARWLGEEEPESLPTRAAWTYRRKQLGVRLLRALVEHFCVPLATEDTPGAFAFGLRLMAMDGTLEDVNDTPANAQYGWRASAKGRRAVPTRNCAACTWWKPGPMPESRSSLLPVRPPKCAWRAACCQRSNRACWCWSIVASSREPWCRPFARAGPMCWVGWPKASLPTKSRSCPMAPT